MEPNFGCSLCPQIAERCCLCSTQRIYLCENCLSTHTRKGDYHPLAPLSTPNFITAQTLPKYIEKLKFVTELRRGVEGAIEEVKTERTKLDEIANRVYEKKAKEVYAICSTMYQEIARYYEKTVKELENLKREISEMLEEKQPLSEETVKFISLGMHWKPDAVLEAENFIESAIRVSSEVVNLANNSYLRRVIEKSDSQCRCEDCKSMEQVLLPSKSQRYIQPAVFSILSGPAVSSQTQASDFSLPNPCWECPACHYEYNTGSTCNKCPTAKPYSQPAVPVIAAPSVGTQYWRCQNCSHEYNTAAVCTNCGVQQGMPRSAVVASSTSSHCWTCQGCGYGYNMEKACLKCNTPNPAQPIQQPQMMHPPQTYLDQHSPQTTAVQYSSSQSSEMYKSMQSPDPPQSMLPGSQQLESPYWVCHCGYQYNLKETCEKCPQKAPSIKDSTYPEPIPNSRQTWKCVKCGNVNSYASRNCASCKVFPECRAAQQPSHYQSQSQGSWMCSVCNTVNYSQSCTNCSTTQNSMLNGGFGNSQGASNPPLNMIHIPNPPRNREFDESYQPPLWTCEFCTYTYNMKNNTTCFRCNKPQSGNIVPWKCWECGQENPKLYDQCSNCQASRVWEEFLMQKEIELSEDRKRWKCKKCEIFMWMDASACTNCKKENEVIAKARAGKANRSGITGWFKGLRDGL